MIDKTYFIEPPFWRAWITQKIYDLKKIHTLKIKGALITYSP